ncbi:hypothetical protein ACLB1O_29875 [Escherichia coli]
MMKNIEEKEKIDAANRRKAQEEQETETGRQCPVSASITKGQSNSRQCDERHLPNRQWNPNQPQPLPKSVRQLMGDTMVKIDDQETRQKNQERDDLQGSQYADGKVSPVLNRRYLVWQRALSCVLKNENRNLLSRYHNVSVNTRRLVG